MAYRRRVPTRKDHRIFTRTAVHGRKINLNARPMRGGIRL